MKERPAEGLEPLGQPLGGLLGWVLPGGRHIGIPTICLIGASWGWINWMSLEYTALHDAMPSQGAQQSSVWDHSKISTGRTIRTMTGT